MKHVTTLLLALALILSMILCVACGGNTNPPDTKDSSSDTKGTETESDTSEDDKPIKKPDTYAPLTLYVASGATSGDGSQSKPFGTIQEARDYIRLLDKSWYPSITVKVAAGTYSTKTTAVSFGSSDSGTESCPITYVADGEVILNGGLVLNPADFKSVTDAAITSRLKDSSKVKVLDLTTLGVTADDWGILSGLGLYSTETFYSDVVNIGTRSCQLFYNGELMNLARYPDTGWLGTGDVIREGEHVQDAATHGHYTQNGNPVPEIYRIDAELAARIDSWKTLDDVWMYGYWKYDWALSSTPIAEFDPTTRYLTPKYSSWYGAEKGKPYYFFNVLEELDAPGEWYLDRAAGLLYMYTPDDFDTAQIDIILSRNANITMSNCAYVTIDGFGMTGTLSTVLYANGLDHVTIKNCHVFNALDNGIYVLNASNTLIDNNVIENIGKVGISITGGNYEDLTESHNVVSNNLIHDYSKVELSQGISAAGVGNTVSHNEIYNAPHQGITFVGPLNIIEYNEIYNVCLEAYDAGGIYIGRTWNSYGSEIRYNFIHNIGVDSGDEAFNAMGIYIDDCASGISIIGNFLLDNPGYDIQIGGGRDIVIDSNFIMTTDVLDPGRNYQGIRYDQRGYEGLLGIMEWPFVHTTHGANDDLWAQLRLYDNEVWDAKFPNRAAIQDYTEENGAFQNIEGNKYFGGNPGCSVIKNNVAIALNFSGNIKDKIGNLVYQYGDVQDYIFINDFKVFKDAATGNYKVRTTNSAFTGHDMKFFDFDQMGRQ